MKLPVLSEGVKSKLALAGYVAFYLCAFVVCLFAAFPYRVLRDRIVLDYAREQKKSPKPKSVTIEALGPAWGGVRATNVKLVSPGERASDKPTSLSIAELVVKPSIAAALVGATDVAFRAEVFGGIAEGRVVSSSSERSMLVKLAHVDLKQSEGAAAAVGLPVEGVVDGSLRLELPEGKGAKANGVAQLEITELAFGDGKAKFRDQLAMPKLVVGTLVLSAEAKDGSLKIGKLAATGKDLELQGDGRIKISDFPGDSVLECGVRFKIADAYRTKNEVTASLFGKPGSSLPGIVEIAEPKLKAAKRLDGFYSFRVRGTLDKPEFTPDPGT
jgi:type II secretion system protein N